MTFTWDLDNVLSLEDDAYRKGYDEGRAQGAREQFLEGKEYGYQTGFQRFLIVGYMSGLVREWRAAQTPGIERHLDQLEAYLEGIPRDNSDRSVEEYESRVKKARNKLRVVCAVTKEPWKASSLDELVREVGGEVRGSVEGDEMW